MPSVSHSVAPLRPETGSRLAQIEFMRAVAIVLVVYGHAARGVVARLPDLGAAAQYYFSYIDYAIYTFHVPIFFVTSGFLLQSRAASGFDRRDWLRRLGRLTLLFLMFNTLNALIELAFSNYTNRDIAGRSLFHLLNPLTPHGVMWFFLALIAAIAIWGVVPARPRLARCALMAGLFLLLLGSVDYSGIAYGTFWFFAGVELATWRRDIPRAPPLFLVATVLLFVAFTAAFFAAGVPFTLAIPSCALAIVFLATIRDGSPNGAAIRALAAASLTIYVLHVPFAAGAREILMRVTGIRDVLFLIAAATIVGVVAPLVLDRAARWIAANVRDRSLVKARG